MPPVAACYVLHVVPLNGGDWFRSINCDRSVPSWHLLDCAERVFWFTSWSIASSQTVAHIVYMLIFYAISFQAARYQTA